MTVGPLPSAVYWRRRAIVGALGLLAVLLTAWGCAAAFGGPAPAQTPPSSGAAAGHATGHPSTAPSQTHPPTAPANTPAPTVAAHPTTAPPPAGPSACADADLTVTPAADGSSVPSGTYPELTLTVANVSKHACTRDVGAGQQEIRLQRSGARLWSSNDCVPGHGTDVRTFRPGDRVTFRLVWAGRTSEPGCKASREVVPPGSYQLIGRIGPLTGRPVPLTIT